jgi:hypothetical protein
MHIVRTGTKGQYISALENYYVHIISVDNLYIDYTYDDSCVSLFKTLNELNDRSQHIRPCKDI